MDFRLSEEQEMMKKMAHDFAVNAKLDGPGISPIPVFSGNIQARITAGRVSEMMRLLKG
jgi:hypothetical protein